MYVFKVRSFKTHDSLILSFASNPVGNEYDDLHHSSVINQLPGSNISHVDFLLHTSDRGSHLAKTLHLKSCTSEQHRVARAAIHAHMFTPVISRWPCPRDQATSLDYRARPSAYFQCLQTMHSRHGLRTSGPIGHQEKGVTVLRDMHMQT